MAAASSLPKPLRSLLKRLLGRWVAVRHLEPDPTTLALNPQAITLYVLPRPALSDALLLECLCRRHDLPPATGRYRVAAQRLPAMLALPRPQRRHRRHALHDAIDLVAEHHDLEIQLIPVSIFWGRAPGKRFGMWRLLAADSWPLTGRLRRALSVLVNGRDVEVQFGAPLHLRDLLDDRGTALAERKAARLLRVHFRRVRTRVLGPDLSHRRTLIQGLVASPSVRQAMAEQADIEGRPQARLARRARRYGHEIASNMTYPVLRFLDGVLRRLWNRLYDGVDVRGLERVKVLAGDHTLVYVPCHRSHIDYLLLSYVLYRDGLMPPHIAAGRNLDMPLIGPLLRRGGAFFLRRSFRGNSLYAAVFTEYLHRLLAAGHPLEFFMEGGRSRSGRLLTPRPGMLAMTLRSFHRLAADDDRQRLAFVPVYIGYERILEGSSYQRELRGAGKRKESPLGLLRVLARLRQPFGRVAVNIGEPLLLAPFLDASVPAWRSGEATSRAPWISESLPRLGTELAQRINAAAALNPVNLVALVLLATPYHAIEESLMARQLALLAALQRRCPGGDHASLPEGEPTHWIDHVIGLGMIRRRRHPLGDILTATPEQAELLAWYRNNVLHLFASAGLVAFAFRHEAHHDLTSLQECLGPPWPILARELFLPGDSLHRTLPALLDALTRAELLNADAQGWRRADALEASEQLRLLGRLMQPSLERGYLLLSLLLEVPTGSHDRDGIIERSQQMAERLAMLSGRNAPEFFDRRLFARLIDSLEAEGWIVQREGRLYYATALPEAAQRTRALFDPALRHRLQLVTRD
ncbi:glycerol-3-phosphate 1-O-acyltransferase PlsB [Billgrantia gudaonensis]|uniref:Glycerol-3-phosphate acyltransferase n=1 Tax=Billgrantia gudaonensis TaxID=376427 RepID=A0A1G8UD89_9GAMM|nr:glycerol-3-phosphate 1-O-acyltransferase PlsB [Halomonas gudaonensis]SDJ51564.1 glycerol-3-phosphate acyltransferase [Halomonas gudaonensis]